MKTIILIGAKSMIGQAALRGLENHKSITASRSGRGCYHKVDIAAAVTSGTIDTFVKCAGYEMLRGIRINVVSPRVLEELWDAFGELMPGFQPVPGRLVGKAFERAVDGFLNGEVIYVEA